MSKLKKRYFLASDDDGHWFIVPVERRSDFDDWVSQDWSSELANFQTPTYVEEVGGDPSFVTFENPVDES